MIHTVVNKRKIIADPKLLFQLIIDCEKWPDFVPECLSVKILKREGQNYLRHLKSRVSGKVVEMDTYCEIFTNELKMKFRQISSPWPLKSNEGEWYLVKKDGKTVEMVLIHRFENKYGLLGDLFASLIMSPFFIHKHGEFVLNAFERKMQKVG